MPCKCPCQLLFSFEPAAPFLEYFLGNQSEKCTDRQVEECSSVPCLYQEGGGGREKKEKHGQSARRDWITKSRRIQVVRYKVILQKEQGFKTWKCLQQVPERKKNPTTQSCAPVQAPENRESMDDLGAGSRSTGELARKPNLRAQPGPTASKGSEGTWKFAPVVRLQGHPTPTPRPWP